MDKAELRECGNQVLAALLTGSRCSQSQDDQRLFGRGLTELMLMVREQVRLSVENEYLKEELAKLRS